MRWIIAAALLWLALDVASALAVGSAVGAADARLWDSIATALNSEWH